MGIEGSEQGSSSTEEELVVVREGRNEDDHDPARGTISLPEGGNGMPASFRRTIRGTEEVAVRTVLPPETNEEEEAENRIGIR